MSNVHEGSRKRVLDPVERLSEVLFGLIMVLSFTCSISAAGDEEDSVRSVLIGALGCNLAWGIVDAVMYLMTILLERGRLRSIGRAVRAQAAPEEARRLLSHALPEPFDRMFDEQALEGARRRLVEHPAPEGGLGPDKQDLLGALAVFLLVFLSTFPVVVPFLLFEPLHRAMRVSNGVAIAMLFVSGHMLGRYSGLSPARTGLVMVAIGVVLVGVTIALGG